MNCTPHQILTGCSNLEEWEGWACSTYGVEERCIRGFGGEMWGTEATWKTRRR
jgi:hypothetical protein